MTDSPSSNWVEDNVKPGDAGPLSVKDWHKHKHFTQNGALKWPPPSGSLHAQYRRAAVATDHGEMRKREYSIKFNFE